jgi:glycosyltransferase involved in cell wall biosynthesis
VRILFVCTGLEAHGGIQRFNRNLVRAWTDLDARTDIVAVNDAPEARWSMSEDSRVRLHGAGTSKLRWLADLAGLLAAGRYDHYVCGHIHLAPAFVAALTIARCAAARRALILHGVEIWDRLTGTRQFAARHFGQVLSVSRYTARSFLNQVPGFPRDRLSLFPNTVSPDLLDREPAAGGLRPATQPLRLLSVTRLDRTERDKGILHVLAALAELPPDTRYEYTIVGDGDDRGFLESQAATLRLSGRITFRGALSDERLWEAYENADVFVLPSRKEGFGIVFLEAMRCGLPVIAAREKGALDVVRDGVNGFLVPFGDIAALRHRLLRCIAAPELLQFMGSAGRRRVVSGEFSYDAFRDRCRRLFHDA